MRPLLKAIRTQNRLKPVKLELREVTEIARGPDIPLPYREVDGRIVEEPVLAAQRAESKEAFRRVFVRQLELTPRKEVFIFVHGYHNSFADASFALGRALALPRAYRCTDRLFLASRVPGVVRLHLRSGVERVHDLPPAIAPGSGRELPEVEKIHLIAHSRGTDVAVAALRELTIAARAAGIDPKEKYKIHNLVLAAPDLDLQVATQRIVGDKLPLSVRRFTVYTSPEDKAIGSPAGSLRARAAASAPSARNSWRAPPRQWWITAPRTSPSSNSRGPRTSWAR